MVFSMLAALAVRADDSTLGFASGGLTFAKSTTVSMTSEDLYLSDAAVKVRYVFLNTTGKDIAARMIFPMPDVTTDNELDFPRVPFPKNNFLGFTTTVNGKPVIAQLQQAVIKGKTDYTALLKGMGLPLAPWLDATNKAIAKLPRAKLAQLEKLGLVHPYEEDDGQGMKKHLMASWTLKESYLWPIVFPAGKPVSVTHNYLPAYSSYAGLRSTMPGDTKDQAKYCIDKNFIAGAAKAHSEFNEEHVSYVLTTGANWKGPIGVFHLTVDKRKAANLVSFCGTGVSKSGPTSYSVTYKNYTPIRNIDVLIAATPG
jgi:hypothetical protein